MFHANTRCTRRKPNLYARSSPKTSAAAAYTGQNNNIYSLSAVISGWSSCARRSGKTCANPVRIECAAYTFQTTINANHVNVVVVVVIVVFPLAALCRRISIVVVYRRSLSRNFVIFFFFLIYLTVSEMYSKRFFFLHYA